MAETALFFAFGCGCIAALMGMRAAAPLLMSVMFGYGLRMAQVQFNLLLWLLCDCIVIALIWRRNMTWAEIAILALFVPAWIGYFVGDPWRLKLGDWAVFVQLLLTLPFPKLQSIGGAISHGTLREVKYEGA